MRVVSSDPIDSVTACITEFNRPDALKRLTASIEKHYPGLKWIVQPTGGNLSWGRNQLAQKCQTPFYLMLEEDFEFDGRERLYRLLDVLKHEQELAGVCGQTFEPIAKGTAGRGGTYAWCREFDHYRNLSGHHTSTQPIKQTPSGTRYQPCELGLCFGIFRNQVFKEIPWDADLPVGCEIIDWFWRVWLDARWHFAVVRKSIVVHHRDRPGPEYNQPRRRNFMPVAQRKNGVIFTGRALKPEDKDYLPNIVFLTQGRSNSTITTKQAVRALKFETGVLDEEFWEEVRIREENRRLWRSLAKTGQATLDRVKVERILRSIPEPWILKEPCWARTLPLWLPVFERYKPLLLYVTKDPETVKESCERAGWFGYCAEDRTRCDQHFKDWPYAKLKMAAEDLGAACAMFDPKRLRTPDAA